jgi:hypothetical protein
MIKSLFVASALALMLAACAGRVGPDGYIPVLVTHPDPMLPNVFIEDDGTVVIDQEPIRTGRVGQPFKVSWALPAASPYVFGPTGITFTDPKPTGFDTCVVTDKTFACTLVLTQLEHKYSILPVPRAGADGKPMTLRALDPHLVGN